MDVLWEFRGSKGFEKVGWGYRVREIREGFKEEVVFDRGVF